VFHPHTDASLTVTSVIVLLLPGVAFIGGVKDAISGWYLRRSRDSLNPSPPSQV
jgi:uncharacterized membrane protein YjjP (DUF1212 family)